METKITRVGSWFEEQLCKLWSNFDLIPSLCRVFLFALWHSLHNKLLELCWNQGIHYQDKVAQFIPRFHVHSQSGTLSDLLNAGRYLSMSDFSFAKLRMLPILRPSKCGTWIVFSWLFFKYYLSCIIWTHLSLSWNNLSNVLSIGLLDRWEIHIGL